MCRNPQCQRELLIRGGLTLIIAAIAYFILGVDRWVWLLPVAIAALVLFKWAVRPADDEEDQEGDISSHA